MTGTDPQKMPTDRDATELLTAVVAGRERAADDLMPLVYDELRMLATGYLTRESSDHTLQPTALVHEAYLRLINQTRVDWQGQTHFKAVAAQAMQRVLADHGRARKRQKRGGNWRRLALYDAFYLAESRDLEPQALDEALQKMAAIDERQAQVVRLRLFGGLTGDEIARLLDVSPRTVDRDWKMGQAWLRRELSEGAPH